MKPIAAPIVRGKSGVGWEFFTYQLCITSMDRPLELVGAPSTNILWNSVAINPRNSGDITCDFSNGENRLWSHDLLHI